MANEKIVIKELVLDILTESEEARNSDKALYMKVCERIAPSLVGKPFNQVFFSFPKTETVRRARQLVQAENRDLRASDKVSGYRLLEEEEFKNFALGKL